jgi:hypothetical protein
MFSALYNNLAARTRPEVQIKRAYLILAFAMASVIALLYGISPAWFATTFLGMSELPTSIAHILRAIMCLYLALACFWLFSAFSEQHRNSAVLTTILFSAGLVTGRLLSFLIDGQPAPLLIFYAAIELLLVPIAAWVYTRAE